MRSCLYEGTVRHRRRDGIGDQFAHRLFMAYLDLDELPQLFDGRRLWSARRPALAWFRRRDYLGDPHVPLADAVRALVLERTGKPAEGPIRLLTHLRCFGHNFNPVSFYYCFAPDGEHVTAVVAEVTNTPWGERHAYVLDVGEVSDHGSAAIISGRFEKVLHVSPLMGMDHVYEWRLTEPGERLAVHIESRRTGGVDGADGVYGAGGAAGRDGAEGLDGGDSPPVFDATLSLRRRELTGSSMAGALARYPFLTVRIIARIYAHALRLRVKGARYFPHPTRGALSS